MYNIKLKKTVKDFIESLMFINVWTHLAFIDIKQKYRGSILGPIWITLSTSVMVVALSVVYTRLFNQDIRILLPFLASGIVIWTYISSIISESTEVFINAKPIIDNIKLPIMIHLFRMIWKNVLIFMHNFVVLLVVIVFFKVPLNVHTLLFIPGFIVLTTLLAFSSLLTALLGTRFRDIPPIISSLIMVVFFVSPITWDPNMIGKTSLIVKCNPLYYMLDLVRSPLLGNCPDLMSWVVCFIILIVTFLVSFCSFYRCRTAIPFWI